jgi:hypothetical protein
MRKGMEVRNENHVFKRTPCDNVGGKRSDGAVVTRGDPYGDSKVGPGVR